MTWLRRCLLGLSAAGLCASTATAVAGGIGPYYAVPSWDQTLPVATRFLLLSNFNDRAFLDRNTGLVWAVDPMEWTGSLSGADAVACRHYSIGKQYGWRLPTFPELVTLLVPLGDHQDPINPSMGMYAMQIQAPFIHYPPRFSDGLTTILSAKHGTSYQFLENQTDTDWNLWGYTENGATVHPHAYVWCVRGPQSGP